jgi:hypothetical protein
LCFPPARKPRRAAVVRSRPFVFSDKNVFELHHAGVREVERRVIRRDQERRRRHTRVPLGFEERQKLFPDFCEFHGVFKLANERGAFGSTVFPCFAASQSNVCVAIGVGVEQANPVLLGAAP